MLPTLIPALAFNPIAPLAIACLMLTTTLLSYFLNKWVEAQAPNDKIEIIKNSDKTHKQAMLNHLTFFTSGKRSELNIEKFKLNEPDTQSP